MSNTLLKTPITLSGRNLSLLLGGLTYAVETNHEESDRHQECKSLLICASKAKENSGRFVIKHAMIAALANGAMRKLSIAEYAPNAFISKRVRDVYTDGGTYTTMTREEVDALFHDIKRDIDASLSR